MYEVLSEVKNKKSKINIILNGKYNDMNGNHDLNQNHYSRTAIDMFESGHDSIRIMKWLVFKGRFYFEIINYYDLVVSILNCLSEIFER